jgi:hypothetical protein
MVLGLALAMPAGANERESNGAKSRPRVEETAPPAREATVWGTFRRRVLSALGRLRLNPGHDSLDRSAAADGRRRQ